MRKKLYILTTLLMIISLCSCGKKNQMPPDEDSSMITIDNTKKELTETTFRATIIDKTNDSILVEPIENSNEINSSDKFSITNKENIEFQIGDLIEITYDGEILETYPAQLREVYKIIVVEQAEPIPSINRVRMIQVDDLLYYDTGEKTVLGGRCGSWDGNITSTVKGNEIPIEDNQSNFGSGYKYQYGEDNIIEVYINQEWCFFKQIDKNELSVINTYEITNSENDFNDDSLVTITKYYEMSDGTWKTDSNTYKYRLVITGRMNGAEKDSTFVYLSNIENITFEQAWKASGLSSSMTDYFNEKDAKLVALR